MLRLRPALVFASLQSCLLPRSVALLVRRQHFSLWDRLEPITEDDLVARACDWGATRKRHDLKDGRQVFEDNAVICIKGEATNVRDFFTRVVPNLSVKFVLVTVESDAPVPESEAWLDTPNLLEWFALNVVVDHPKLTPLPLGLNKVMHLESLRAAMSDVPPRKNGRMMINFSLLSLGHHPELFHPDGFRDERGRLWDLAGRWGFADRSESLGKDFHGELRKYAFALCPEGYGWDTHRLWEALYLQVQPVVQRSPGPMSRVFEGLPVIQVGAWEDVTRELLEAAPRPDWEAALVNLDLNTWVKRIRSRSVGGPGCWRMQNCTLGAD